MCGGGNGHGGGTPGPRRDERGGARDRGCHPCSATVWRGKGCQIFGGSKWPLEKQFFGSKISYQFAHEIQLNSFHIVCPAKKAGRTDSYDKIVAWETDISDGLGSNQI